MIKLRLAIQFLGGSSILIIYIIERLLSELHEKLLDLKQGKYILLIDKNNTTNVKEKT